MKTFALVRDVREFGSNALDLGWERRKTVLAVIGGAAILAVAGVIVSRLLRGRAAAPTVDAMVDAAMPDTAASTADSMHTNLGKGPSSNGSMAKAAKL
jgi:hypothetical protein